VVLREGGAVHLRRLQGYLSAEFAAEFRRAIAENTTEAMRRKAQAGFVTGGKTFGYDNVPAPGGKRHRINEAEAAVVREIFSLAAEGKGLRVIAHLLNARGVPTPRAQQGRPSGWDMGTIRAILLRPLYRGQIVWNRSKKRDADGEQRQRPGPTSDWLTIDAPELRIVPDDLFEAATAQRARRSAIGPNGKHGLGGRPAKYLLTGLIRCACGAKYEARGLLGVYVCAARLRKGPTVCSNDLSFTIRELDQLALDCIEGQVLSEAFIDRILSTLPASTDHGRTAAERELHAAEQAVANLVALAKTAGVDIPALAAEIATESARVTALRRRLDALPEGRQQNRETLRAAMLQ
jgi:site-specific DNA recombinase